MAGRVHLWIAYFTLAGIAGLTGVIAAIWMPPEQAAAVAAAAAAVTALPVTRVSARIDTIARQRELIAASLYAVSASGRLPRVRNLNDPIALGVHAAEPVAKNGVEDRVAPFIRRDREADVHAAVASGGFVLIVGESTAGKTRLAYEALRALRPNHTFACPTPSELLALLPAVRKEKRCVVWLDDLERYLGAQGLTITLLAQLLGDGSRDVLVLATMRAHEHHQFLSPPTKCPQKSEPSESGQPANYCKALEQSESTGNGRRPNANAPQNMLRTRGSHGQLTMNASASRKPSPAARPWSSPGGTPGHQADIHELPPCWPRQWTAGA